MHSYSKWLAGFNSKHTEQPRLHEWVLYHDRQELHDHAPLGMPQSRPDSGREEQ